MWYNIRKKGEEELYNFRSGSKTGKGNTVEDVPQNTGSSLAAASSVGQDSVLCPATGLPVGGGLPVVVLTLQTV
jgi:hypothetical protein